MVTLLRQGSHAAGLASVALLACTSMASAQSGASASPEGHAVIPATVPLRIGVVERVNLKKGTAIRGELLEPVFVGTQLVLPAHAMVTGHVIETPPVEHALRRDALLNGDFTPLKVPIVSFDTVQLPGGAVLPIETLAHVRDAALIRFVPRKKQSLFARLKGMAQQRIETEKEQVTAPHKSDRLLRLAFNQLPYHPQRIWADTDFDADLQAPLTVSVPPAPALIDAPEDALLAEQPIVKARLTEGVSSDTAKKGEPIHAVLTEPAFDHAHRLLFPEGAALTGIVLQAKPSRSFGRNGTLRFGFRSVQPVQGQAQATQGQVTAAEGQSSANVSVDAEGGVHANPDKNRFLGPFVLGVLAASGADEDGGAARQGAASNGLGIVVRVVGLAAGSQPFAVGVGAYGFLKSTYRHFLAHGKPVAFPRDTALEVQLSSRR